jgi:hypothetical protein
MTHRGQLLAGSAYALLVLAVPQAGLAQDTDVAGENGTEQPQSSS